MPKRIYVGNLPFSASDDEVRELFAEYGPVTSVDLVTDRDTGRPRGFGFVEMESGADEAIAGLAGTELGGRSLNINEARPRR
jgi:RNA recognition motif-containing protein